MCTLISAITSAFGMPAAAGETPDLCKTADMAPCLKFTVCMLLRAIKTAHAFKLSSSFKPVRRKFHPTTISLIAGRGMHGAPPAVPSITMPARNRKGRTATSQSFEPSDSSSPSAHGFVKFLLTGVHRARDDRTTESKLRMHKYRMPTCKIPSTKHRHFPLRHAFRK